MEKSTVGAYIKPERIWLKDCQDLDERWVQARIEEDPSILGLGDLVVRDRDRIQRGAGRPDLLLQDLDTKRRFEVELQLGRTDESHIVRTIESWDIERKRYPKYEHWAVLIAEDITSRFLNVISLFNGAVPLIAIQMQALRIGAQTTLVFTTVLNELSRGFIDADEDAQVAFDVQVALVDRSYWEIRGSKSTVMLVDELLNLMHRFNPSLSLKYNKFYIGVAKDSLAFNFVSMVPKKNHVNLQIKLSRSDYVDSKIEAGELETLEYNDAYRLRLTSEEIAEKGDLIQELMKLAYDAKSN